MKKKSIVFMLILVFTLSAVACGNSNDENDGGSTENSYDENGGGSTETFYDENGNISKITEENNDGTFVEKIFENGVMVSETIKFPDGSLSESFYENGLKISSNNIGADGVTAKVDYFYDEHGECNRMTMSDSLGFEIEEFYENGILTKKKEVSPEVTREEIFDENGYLIEEIMKLKDGEGSHRQYVYFGEKQCLLKEEITSSDGSFSRKETYSYNENGECISCEYIDASNNTSKFSYYYENGSLVKEVKIEVLHIEVMLDGKLKEEVITYQYETIYENGIALSMSGSSDTGVKISATYDENGKMKQEIWDYYEDINTDYGYIITTDYIDGIPVLTTEERVHGWKLVTYYDEDGTRTHSESFDETGKLRGVDTYDENGELLTSEEYN